MGIFMGRNEFCVERGDCSRQLRQQKRERARGYTKKGAIVVIAPFGSLTVNLN